MKAVIIQFPFGVVAFDEKSNLAEKILFSKKPQVAARKILKTEEGKVSEETASLIYVLQRAGYDTFLFENAKVAEEVQKSLGVKTEVSKPVEVKPLQARMEQIAVEAGLFEDAKELGLWNRNVSMELAKLRVKGAAEKRDLVIAQAIQTLDDLDRTVNLFMGRLREWYGVHFPELDRLIEKHETYARLIMNLGYKKNFTVEALEKQAVPKERAENIEMLGEKSMGADMAERDLAEIQALSKSVLGLYQLRKNMERYVEKTMEEVAPNTKAVAGALLGARLIAIAGSLQNLAMRPASTIQVLGAEKALFRSLKTGARPPKHGLIFQHVLLHDAKRWQRGKIARVLAGKLAIAARTDAFGDRYVGDSLKADIDRRLAEIREKYKEAPPPKEKPPEPERRERREQRSRGRDKRRRDKKWRKNRSAR
ncbi:MAG: C/D box methylation guide ribonucleoprotein complex aNOP56 subunit [Candidatus Bathyarchaeota archaeon]|nr:C/D box methylation guide ribonucleoprotein complex aNOP56 subunit [Candidatus Bathyarchaeota archaeon]